MRNNAIAILAAFTIFGASSALAAWPLKGKKQQKPQTPIEDTRRPFDPSAEAPDSLAAAAAPASVEIADSAALNGEWTIVRVYHNEVKGEDERPYLYFDLSQNRFYGNNGCNLINGDLKLSGANSVRFTNILTTSVYCPDAEFEHQISGAFPTIKTCRVYRKGHELYAELLNGGGVPAIVLRKHNMNFLTGIWKVESINGAPNNVAGMELAIDVDAARIHGNTGCNIVNGALLIDPDKHNSMQFVSLASTLRLCPDAESEQALLVALEDTEKAVERGADRVALLDSDGNELLILTRQKQQ